MSNSTSPPPPDSLTSLPPASLPSQPPAPSSSPPPPAPASASPPATPGGTATPATSPSSPPPPPSTPGDVVPSTPSPSRPSSSSPPSPSTLTSSYSPPSPPSSSSSSSPSSGNVSTSLVIGVAVGGAVLLLLLTLACLCCFRRRRKTSRKDDAYRGQAQGWHQNVPPPADHVVKIPPMNPPPAHASRPPLSPPPPPLFSSTGDSGSNNSVSENPLPSSSPGLALGFSKSSFTFEELTLATGGFTDANLLGQGGFGYVHRGMLPNGKEIAVKQLKSGSGQGDREFQAEVEIISRVHHKHLVSLVGYCIAGDKRLLVYEFVPNNTLEFHLHGKGRPCLEWSTRLKIALGSAKGLAYLHEDCNPKIIHRDIKTANILLDFKFEPKVADFGLAKLSSDNNTHVSTRVMGTFGYMAPEYAASGKLTEKSDVFSYGIMLLELITGKRPVDTTNSYMDDSLVDWARPLLTRAIEVNKYDTLADTRLQQIFNHNEMARMVSCAAACVRHSARRRPRMSQIVRALEGDASLDDLHDGVKPGHSSVYGSYGSSDYDSGQYHNDMIKFKKLALASQEYPSTEYSEPTSEYGQNPSGSSSEGPVTREMDSGNAGKVSKGFR